MIIISVICSDLMDPCSTTSSSTATIATTSATSSMNKCRNVNDYNNDIEMESTNIVPTQSNTNGKRHNSLHTMMATVIGQMKIMWPPITISLFIALICYLYKSYNIKYFPYTHINTCGSCLCCWSAFWFTCIWCNSFFFNIFSDFGKYVEI